MKPWIETVRDVMVGRESLRRRSYGVIEARRGQLVHVRLKPWPKIGSVVEAHWIRNVKAKYHAQDVCRLFYNQPVSHQRYLTLSYVESSINTTLKTFYATLNVLDQIACLKQADAILAEVTNRRISDRAMIRWGWERHLDHKRKRHWIKRFYGEYPVAATRILDQESLDRSDLLTAARASTPPR